MQKNMSSTLKLKNLRNSKSGVQLMKPKIDKTKTENQSYYIRKSTLHPDVYFDHGRTYHQELRKRHMYIYQPPQIFTRNNLDVPVFTRVYDMMHVFAHCSNHNSVFDLTFPLSNYALSYNLIKRILGYLRR